MRGGTCRGRGAQERRLGWPHHPSVLRVRSPGLEAGLVKPTQPTILFDNRVITKGSRLKPLPQERVAGASPWAWSERRRPTGGDCGAERRQGRYCARDPPAGARWGAVTGAGGEGGRGAGVTRPGVGTRHGG